MHQWTLRHLLADENGISRVDPHFTQTLEAVEFAPPAPPMLVSAAIDAKALVMVELPTGWQGGWHHSPQKQWVICLAGEMGYEAEDGTQFTLKPGSCIFSSDIQGKGHRSWNAGNEPVRLALVQV